MAVTSAWIRKLGPLVALATAALAPVAAGAEADERAWWAGGGQGRAEATVYRDPYYNGPAMAVHQANPNTGLVWPVNSIRVKSGRWQLCEQINYRGTCRTYDADRPMLRAGSFAVGYPVRSLRPVGFTGGSGEPGRNPSLRGMAAEFYPAPARNGVRELACGYASANATCAAVTADRFCVGMGYRGATRQALETVLGRVYLADVLCSRTGY